DCRTAWTSRVRRSSSRSRRACRSWCPRTRTPCAGSGTCVSPCTRRGGAGRPRRTSSTRDRSRRFSAGAELGPADRAHRPPVEADRSANVVRTQQAANPHAWRRRRALRRVVDVEPAVHRGADAVLMVEAEHMAELMRRDESHDVAVLAVADAHSSADDATVEPPDAGLAGDLEPPDAEEHVGVLAGALHELHACAARVP